jgi:hypothetical protein
MQGLIQMDIEIPQELLNQIKKLGEQTQKEIEENIIKISRQNGKTVLRHKNEVLYIDAPTESIDKKRVR